MGLIAVTSAYQEWAYGGSVERLVQSPYGRTIIAKIALFSVLLILGAFNRYISVPRLQAREALAAERFMRTVRLEAFLLVGVLLCAALLRHQAPARSHAARLEHRPQSHGDRPVR